MKRRTFIGYTYSAIPFISGIKKFFPMTEAPQAIFKTRLCDMLGIEYPIIQAGMANVAGPELVAAVSNAGGLGILSATMVAPELLREQIHTIRSLTDRAFGVNLILHQDFFPPANFDIDDKTIHAVQNVLNGFRNKLGIPTSEIKPPKLPPLIQKAYEIILEQRVPLFSIGLGNPTRQMVSECHKNNIKVMVMVSTVEDAMEVIKSDPDIIVAQGSEAGGHRSTWIKKPSKEYASIGTLALVSQIAKRMKIPVVAAGGITDGTGLIGALSIGAEGVLMGTRFIATEESVAPECYKQKIIQESGDNTTVTDVFTGMYARVIRNAFTENYASVQAPVLPPGRQYAATLDITKAAAQQQNSDYYTLYAGQGIDNVREILPAKNVIQNTIAEALSALERQNKRIIK